MSTSASYKPTEGKREEFRRYLEKSGVMDALTKVLVCLYEEPEKPADALQYLITTLTVQTGGQTVEAVKAQLAEAQARIENMQKEIDTLKSGQAEGAGSPTDEVPPPEENPDEAAPPNPEEN